MSASVLLVDGRLLDDHHPGVRRFWVPVLCAWARLGGRGLIVYRRGHEPDPQLIAAGFSAIAVRHAAHDLRGLHSTRRIVRQTAATATLSPLYLTLDDAPQNVGTVFDLIGRSHPRSWRSRLLWEAMMRHTVGVASRVVCATAVVSSELAEAFPRLRDRIAVVSPVAPSAPPRDQPHAGLAGPYALVVASHRPHKRLTPLATAWRASGSTVPLVMLGIGTECLHAPPLVHGLGFASDAELDSWLAGAACLVSASVAEGFGLPMLAALAAGVPMVATRQSAMQEVAGDAAYWLASDDLVGLVGAALSVIADPSGCCARVERGRWRAQAFTATQAAHQLASALE